MRGTGNKNWTKFSSNHIKYFTEHLAGMFRKSPRESDWDLETSSFLIRQLKNDTDFTLQQFPLIPKQIDTAL
jgi:hypothetical protein